MATNRLEKTPRSDVPLLPPTPPQSNHQRTFQVSSPVAVAASFNPDISDSGDDDPDDTFRYLPGQSAPLNRIDDTLEDESELTIRLPPGNNFKERPHKVLKFVDDFLGIEKLSLHSGQLFLSQNRPQRMIRAYESENFFNTVETSCTSLGMSVNAKKTQLLAISPSNEDVSTHIKLPNGQKIESQETLKILGFVFGKKPNVSEHIKHLSTCFRSRLWLIRHLRAAHIPDGDLAKLYQVLVVPTLDYAVPVYHSQLTQEQSDGLEKMQARALKIIFGYEHSYRELLEMSGIESLWERREKLMDKFITKLAANERFAGKWLPRKEFQHHDLRKELVYKEKFARTERLYRSPKYYIRRRLNEKRYELEPPK